LQIVHAVVVENLSNKMIFCADDGDGFLGFSHRAGLSIATMSPSAAVWPQFSVESFKL